MACGASAINQQQRRSQAVGGAGAHCGCAGRLVTGGARLQSQAVIGGEWGGVLLPPAPCAARAVQAHRCAQRATERCRRPRRRRRLPLPLSASPLPWLVGWAWIPAGIGAAQI